MGDTKIMGKKLETECHISFTIERQLKAYMECKEHTERHEILWHEWNHNKRWLILVQQLILPSFPSYSMHDVTHAECVLHNIEMLLGEDNIKLLSASDCFLILHTVYIHDIGMCITDEDKKNIIKDENFHDFLEQLSHDTGSGMDKHAETLLEKCKEINSNSEKDENQIILNKKLDIYYAVTYLLAEYCRTKHGDISSKRLINWIDSPDKLGAGFSTMEIPDRLFYIIANCANTHTKWDFDEVLKLNQEDSGFAHDYVHPRFIAILLQLGDALDMDNDRFHPLFKEYIGKVPLISELHYGKHKAIRRLRITNQKISISADCKNQDILRLVRQECDGIKTILQNATYYWSVIRPKEINVGLPTFDKTKLLLDGKEIPEDLVETRFEIPQDKAFHLLEGNNIYLDSKFVFLREFLQNAIDATKIQYYRDCKQQKRRANIENILKPHEIQEVISPTNYPVEISFTIAKREGMNIEEVTKEDLEKIKGENLKDIDKNKGKGKNKDADKDTEDIIYGVSVKIHDYGTGINGEDIKQIAKVGTSYEKRKKEIEAMPKWLQTTGVFGIGLQSAFLSSNVITAETYTRKEECYEITFYPRRSTSHGYINVKPIVNEDYQEPYGTCFTTFIPFEKKKLHKDSPETWDGTDPFEKGYDKMRAIRHSRELIKQMALYLADMVGEPLFPINLYIKDGSINDEKELDQYYNNRFKKMFQNSGITPYINGTNIRKENNSPDAQYRQVSWAYNFKDNNYIITNGDDLYFFDPEKIKLYVWNYEYNAFACFGIERILSMRDNLREDNKDKSTGVKIFYKGIKVSERSFRQDANLIEYIDLKDSLKEDLLRLNRNGFSEKGYEYLDKVYKAIVRTGHNAFKLFAEENYKDNFKKYKEEITKKLKLKLSEKELQNENLEEVEYIILSVAVLVYFATVSEKHELFKENNQQYKVKWNEFLEKIITELDEAKNNQDDDTNVAQKVLNGSTLFNVPVFSYGKSTYNPPKDPKENWTGTDKLSVLEIVNMKKKFVIVSKRDENNKLWSEYLVEIYAKDESSQKDNKQDEKNKQNDEQPKTVHDEIKNKIKLLHNERNIGNRNDIIAELDKAAHEIMDKQYTYHENSGNESNSKEYENKDNIKKQIQIIKWFLNNVPTIAIFASKDGNTRLNVLDTETCDSIYFSSNMKKLIIQKMLNEYKNHNISRFSTIVWSGYRYLALEQNRNSILPVNRGKISNIGYAEMIFPLTGENLQQLLDIKNCLEKVKPITNSNLYNKYIKVIIINVKKIEGKNTLKGHFDNRMKILFNDVKNSNDVKSRYYKDAELLNDIQLNDKDVKQYIDNLKEDIELQKPENNIDNIICAFILEVLDVKEKLDKELGKGQKQNPQQESKQVSNVNSSWNKDIINREPYRNMIKYVTQNTKMKVQESQIKTLYSYFMEEVYVTIQSIKNNNLAQELKKLFPKELEEFLTS